MHQDPPGRELQLFNLARDPTEQVGELDSISIDCVGTAGGPGRQEAGCASQAAAAGGPTGAGGAGLYLSLHCTLHWQVRPSFQPNRLSLGYPRYQVLHCTALRTDLVWQEGLLRPGWCSSGWWQILWRQNDTHAALLDSLLASIQQ